MKRLPVYILALVVLAMLAAFAFLALSKSRAIGLSPDSGGNVQTTTGNIEDSSPNYVVDAQYPQFGIPAIDSQIKKAVTDAVVEFEALPPNPPDSATPQDQFTGTYDKVYIGPDVISFELILSQYTGGAHNLTLVSGMNFNRATGQKLGLDDALRLIGLTVGQVSAQATSQFRENLGSDFFADGANTNPENFSSFIISAEQVTFIFQQYQVAPYSDGPQYVSFERKL